MNLVRCFCCFESCSQHPGQCRYSGAQLHTRLLEHLSCCSLQVTVDWSRKLTELKKKMDSFVDHCLSEDDVSYDLSDKITRLHNVLPEEDKESITKAMNRQINILQQKEKKKINFSIRQALQLKVMFLFGNFVPEIM